MTESSMAVELRHVSFHYLTARKVPWIGSFPIRKIVYEKISAVEDISLDIRSHRITALLGKNGSGKTTLIKLITGSRVPQEGSIKVFGESPTVSRSKIGLFMGSTLIYHRLTGRENLEYFGKLYGVRKLNQKLHYLSDTLGLGPYLDKLVEAYSFGTKIKLGLARAMIHSPELLILDEPTLGIDLPLALALRKFIRELKCTVLLTTHYMEEAHQLADDLCIIDKGRIVDSGEKNELLKKHGVNTVPEMFTGLLASSESRECSA